MPQERPSEIDVLRVRHLVRFWVCSEADREDITSRLLEMQELLTPFRPSKPMRLFRNERKKGEAGWDEQYDFATAWSLDVYDAKVFGDKERRLVTALAQPQDILVSIPMVEFWANAYGLGTVDAELQDEVVVFPHPSFEDDRLEIPDDVTLAEMRKNLWEPVVDAWRAEQGDVPPNALAEAARLVDGLDDHQVPVLEEKLKTLPVSKEAQSVFHGTPHEFEEFKLDHIGRGEGAMAYGWGLYFTSLRAVAEYYRKSLSDTSDHVIYIWRGQEFEGRKGPEAHALGLAYWNGILTARRIAQEGLRDAKAKKPYAMSPCC